MAELYVNGPKHLQGRWAECAIFAGMAEPPALNDPTMKMLIERKGGTVQEAEPLAPDVSDEIADLVEASETGAIPWKELRKRLAVIMGTIISGKVKASPSQVKLITYINEKAEEADSLDAEGVTHIVLLPTKGEQATLEFDPAWRAKVAKLEAADAS